MVDESADAADGALKQSNSRPSSLPMPLEVVDSATDEATEVSSIDASPISSLVAVDVDDKTPAAPV